MLIGISVHEIVIPAIIISPHIKASKGKLRLNDHKS